MPVILRVEIGRRWIGPHVAQAQPLPGEVRHEGLGLRVGKHPIDLLRARLGIGQPPLIGEPTELGVRLARPEEIGEPRSELVIGERLRAIRRMSLDEIEEVGAGEHCRERELDPLHKRQVGGRCRENRDLLFNLRARHRPTVGLAHESPEDLPHVRIGIRRGERRVEEDLGVRGWWPGVEQGPLDLHPVEQGLRSGKAVFGLQPEVLEHRRD
jgi:hypothetical protein